MGALLVVSLSCGAIGLMLRPGRVPEADAPDVPSVVGAVVAGAAFGGAGVAVYGLTLATRCFTFRFDRPFFRGYRFKGWVLKVVIELFLSCGFSFLCSPTLVAVLYGTIPGRALTLVSLGIPFLVAQFLFAWLATMGPVERSLIVRRMVALGLGPDRSPGGVPVGVSDPAKSSLKKFPLVEEDLGMLWFSPTHLSFRGDTTMWDFAREDVLDVERKADAGATSSYFGAVHVVLRVRQADGGERRVRLHPEGAWTQTGTARALEALATRLNLWRSTGITG
jgi:hypothetical protein